MSTCDPTLPKELMISPRSAIAEATGEDLRRIAKQHGYEIVTGDMARSGKRQWALQRICLALGDERDEFLQSPKKLIEDTITEFLKNHEEQMRRERVLHNAVTNGTYIKSHNQKVGRNEPCYCGSGKKYKRCCL